VPKTQMDIEDIPPKFDAANTHCAVTTKTAPAVTQ